LIVGVSFCYSRIPNVKNEQAKFIDESTSHLKLWIQTYDAEVGGVFKEDENEEFENASPEPEIQQDLSIDSQAPAAAPFSRSQGPSASTDLERTASSELETDEDHLSHLGQLT